MHIKPLLFGMSGLALVGAGLLALQRQPEPVAPAAPAAPAAPSSARPVPQAVLVPAAVGTAEPSLQEQVARLEANHDPADAFKAYRLLSDCAVFMSEHDRLIRDDSTSLRPRPGQIPGLRNMTDEEKRHDTVFCARMSERERQARLDDLAIAVKAMVPGAAAAFMLEGPFGNPTALRTRPGDPLVQEWKARANAQMVRAAESGTDMDALLDMAMLAENGNEVLDKNPPLAYRYKLAVGIIFADKLGAGSMLAKDYAADSPGLLTLGQDLSPEQRAAELAAARRIAEIDIAARRGHQGRQPELQALR